MILNKIFCHCRATRKLYFSASTLKTYFALETPLFESNRRLSYRLKFDHLVAGQKTYVQSVRFKYSNKKNTKNPDRDEEEDSDEEAEENIIEDIDKNTKIIKCSVNSLRADLILKSGLGLARNKVETIFYDSKIRVNGRKLMKKSINLKVGDEIDVVKGKSTMNPDDIVVARIEILAAVPKNDSIYVTLKRFKSLQIQNYDKDPISV